MNKFGFSLLELSIVLAIIGLVIGGITVGGNMLRVSELNAMVSEVQNIKQAVDTFESKYQSLPGDMPDINNFFSGQFNGDGNAFINYNWGSFAEEYAVWAHLGAASLIDGEYEGMPWSLPESPVDNGFFRLSHQTNVYGIDGHMLSLNGIDSGSPLAHHAILTPQEAASIDEKMDDGEADQGRILTFNPSGVPGCITNYYPAGSGDYILSNDGVLCKMFFVLDDR